MQQCRAFNQGVFEQERPRLLLSIPRTRTIDDIKRHVLNDLFEHSLLSFCFSTGHFKGRLSYLMSLDAGLAMQEALSNPEHLSGFQFSLIKSCHAFHIKERRYSRREEFLEALDRLNTACTAHRFDQDWPTLPATHDEMIGAQWQYWAFKAPASPSLAAASPS